MNLPIDPQYNQLATGRPMGWGSFSDAGDR